MNEKKKLEKITSFCLHCGDVARWEVPHADRGKPNELCSECSPLIAMLCAAEMKIKMAELTIADFIGKANSHARVQLTIARERIVEGETERRVAREKLYAMMQKRKHELLHAQEKN